MPKAAKTASKVKTNGQIVNVDFKKRKKLQNRTAALRQRRLQQKLMKYLSRLKKELPPKHYLMVLEAVASAGHHQRITNQVLITHLKAINEME